MSTVASLYIVTHGSYVRAATYDAAELDSVTAKELRFANASEHEWREEEGGHRKELCYKDANTSRWNRSKRFLTVVDVAPPEAPRYEVRDSERGGYVVWDTSANRPAARTVYDDAEQAQSYANVRNESAATP